MRKLADQQKIPLPPVLGVKSLRAPTYRRVFSDFVGAWGGRQRWNQTGRNAILIIESVDEKGNVSGILAQGPPTPTSAGQNPASFTAFAAEETDGVINFTWGTFTYSFRRLPGKLLWGHLEGLVAQRRVGMPRSPCSKLSVRGGPVAELIASRLGSAAINQV